MGLWETSKSLETSIGTMRILYSRRREFPLATYSTYSTALVANDLIPNRASVSLFFRHELLSLLIRRRYFRRVLQRAVTLLAPGAARD